MARRLDEETLLSLVEQIYETTIDPSRWPSFLTAFARAVNARPTLIYTHNVETADASLSPDSGSLNAAVDFDAEYIKTLGEHYSYVNVWAQNEAVLKPGRPVTGSMLYPVSELPKTEFYNDWLKPQDLFHALGGLIVQDGAWAIKFSSLRSKNAGDYTPEEIRLYEQLLPHLARAVRVHQRFAFLQELASSSLSVLEVVSAPVILLDAQGRVLHLNEAAGAEVRRADPLRLRASGELHTNGGTRAQTALSRVIASALDPVRGVKAKLDSSARLHRRNGESLDVQAVPLPRREGMSIATVISQRLAACALIIRERNASPVPDVGQYLLRHVYQLTPAEVQVVVAISNGETLKRYAERRGISRHTAANQLKRAFEKTGLRRQSDLVRWFLNCQRPHAPHSPIGS